MCRAVERCKSSALPFIFLLLRACCLSNAARGTLSKKPRGRIMLSHFCCAAACGTDGPCSRPLDPVPWCRDLRKHGGRRSLARKRCLIDRRGRPTLTGRPLYVCLPRGRRYFACVLYLARSWKRPHARAQILLQRKVKAPSPLLCSVAKIPHNRKERRLCFSGVSVRELLEEERRHQTVVVAP